MCTIRPNRHEEYQLSPLRYRVDRVLRFAIQTYLPMIFGVTLSLLVIRRHGPELWGQWVAVAIVCHLLAHVLTWGNRDDVLRRLSRDGEPLSATLRQHLLARLRALYGPTLWVLALVGWLASWSVALVTYTAVWVLMRAIAQSFQAPIVHEERFATGALADGVGQLVPLAIIALFGVTTIEDIGAWIVLGETIRVCLLMALLPWLQAPNHGSAQPKLELTTTAVLQSGLPFFMVSAATMVASRVDLYCVTAKMPAAEVARYQVIVNATFGLQSIAGLLIVPFSRELYQSSTKRLLSILSKLSTLGAFISVLGAVLIYVLITIGYRMQMSTAMLGLVALYSALAFPQSLAVVTLYKSGLERLVVKASAAMIVGNLMFNLWWLPIFGLEGALGATALVSTALTLFYVRRAYSLQEPE